MPSIHLPEPKLKLNRARSLPSPLGVADIGGLEEAAEVDRPPEAIPADFTRSRSAGDVGRSPNRNPFPARRSPFFVFPHTEARERLHSWRGNNDFQPISFHATPSGADPGGALRRAPTPGTEGPAPKGAGSLGSRAERRDTDVS